MAVPFSHIQIGLSSTHGPQLRSVLSALEAAHRGLADQVAVMATMLAAGTDGSSSTHFPEVTARYGFQSDEQAKAAWDELNSVNAKLHTDAQVTSVDSAIKQVGAKFR